MKELNSEEKQVVKCLSSHETDEAKKQVNDADEVSPITEDEKANKVPKKSFQEEKVDLELKNNKQLEKLEIGNYIFVLGEDPTADKELRTLVSILRWESTHFQFSK